MKKLLSLTAFVLCISLATTVYAGGHHGGYYGHGGGYYCSGNGWNDGWAVAAAVLGTAIVLNAITKRLLYTSSCCCPCGSLGNPTDLGTRNKPKVLG